MTNSDYLIKAAVKKLSEKLNQTLIEKVEEASSVAQEVPTLLKKEFEMLIDEIFQEAKKMEKYDNNEDNIENQITQIETPLTKCDQKIKEINMQLEKLNKKLKN